MIIDMDISKLKECVNSFASENELFVIEANCNESNVVSITIDAMNGVSLEKCIELNKHIESQFDREIEDYELTVSSASISEPFKHIMQYRKNEGSEVEVMFIANSEKLIGVMDDVTEDGFSLMYSKKVQEEGKKRKELKEFCDKIAFSDVKKVTLVIKF